jgi:hypothetical protein
MPTPRLIWVLTALTIAGASPALAQKQPEPGPPPAPAPARPYKPVAVTPPKPMNEPGLDALRKQLGEAVKRKDRAALTRLVVAKDFFWERQNGDGADKKKSGIDNLTAALGLNNKDGVGWDLLGSYAEDPSAALVPDRKDMACAPADPTFDGKAFDDLLKASQTDETEWAFPVADGLAVHAKPEANAPTVEKLGLNFVRVMPEDKPVSAAYVRVVTPSGKTGYVTIDAIAPLGNDQICYVKESGGWKIGGYIGGGEPQ